MRETGLSVVLGQFGGNNTPDPMLAPPPMLEHYLLENPIPTVSVLVLLAVIVFGLLYRRGKAKRGLQAGLGLILAAIAVVVIATGVRTAREKLIERTATLIDATARADVDELKPMLDADVRVVVLDGMFRVVDREAVLAQIDQQLGRNYPIASYTLSDEQAELQGDGRALTLARIRVRVQGSPYDYPTGSWWQVRWTRHNGVWIASEVRCVVADWERY